MTRRDSMQKIQTYGWMGWMDGIAQKQRVKGKREKGKVGADTRRRRDIKKMILDDSEQKLRKRGKEREEE